MKLWNLKLFRHNHLDTVFFNRETPLKALLEHIPSPVIFDVGANIGQTAIEFRRMFPDSTLHCFEPLPDEFRSLKRNCASIGAAHAYPLALSDKAEIRDFYRNKKYSKSSGLVNLNMDALSIVKNTHPKDGFDAAGSAFETIKVETTTLDRFAEEAHVARIDLLKLDTQGAEESILSGAKSLLESGNIGVILTEISLDGIFSSSPSFGKIEAILTPNGYSLFDICHVYKDLSLGRTCWVDAIYIHKKILDKLQP